MDRKHSGYQTELRHLLPVHRHRLVGLLDVNDNWKVLASRLPNPDRPNDLLLQTTHILLLEQQRKRPSGSPSSALLEYWSTYGRHRHTFGEAIYLLEECGLHRAADVIKNSLLPNESDVLNVNALPHSWSELPEYWSNFHVKPTAPNESLISFSTENFSKSEQLIRFTYRSIQLATDNFDSTSIEQGGNKLGEGSFGEVFRCATALLNSDQVSYTKFVAVKRFKHLEEGEEKRSEFLAELNTMYRFQHPNVVRLLGYSNDGPHLCIITEYLENGSLHNFLISQSRLLKFEHRWQIAFDVANAITYLHTYASMDSGKPFIHRDIKSANIFLDCKLGARLGDLGLVRQGSTSNTLTTVVTSTVIGTSVYMAPEAFRGDVSVKIDTFSYGVVLFELLTGLPAFDASRDGSDIVSFIDELLGDEFDQLPQLDHGSNLVSFAEKSLSLLDRSKLRKVLDEECQNEIAEKLIVLAKCCIEQRKRNRPTMIEVFDALKQLQTTGGE